MTNGKQLLPLEKWLENQCEKNSHLFPSGKDDYFIRYLAIKNYLKSDVYGWIGAGTSSEDQGIYTDHSENHFNSVIRYAEKLIGFDIDEKVMLEQKLKLEPYEVFIMLVSILLHDAGNIEGRKGHETKPLKIFHAMGPAACPDRLEAPCIANIAKAHGGKVRIGENDSSKDTIGQPRLKENDSYGSATYRSKLIAALVRFADEICEDRSRAARYLINNNSLPEKSKIYHLYAESVSSVGVDIPSKSVHVKFEVYKSKAIKKFGKDINGNVKKVYLIDEISARLEKMFCELIYCRTFMYEVVDINKIRATIDIIDDGNDEDWPTVQHKTFELEQEGYPSDMFLFKYKHPEWTGSNIRKILENKNKGIK